MKKLLLILGVVLLGLTSCKKEEIEKKYYVSFVGDIDNGYCKINGDVKQTFNPIAGAPIYQCYSGDILEYVDNGTDYTSSTPTTFPLGGGPPSGGQITYHEGYVEGYIIVTNELGVTDIVKQYIGNGNANLRYKLP